MLERAIAERGRYPAINVLRFRLAHMPGCNSAEEQAIVSRARQLLATYEDMAELIRLGSLSQGADPKRRGDQVLAPIEQFLGQHRDDRTSLAEGYAALARILRHDGAGRLAAARAEAA